MTELLEINQYNPQTRLIKKVVDVLKSGGIIVFPTDSCYAIGCRLNDKDAIDKILRIRNESNDHFFSILVDDLSMASEYAKVSNKDFKFIKKHTPGPFTFILPSLKDLYKKHKLSKRKTIGIRIPDRNLIHALLKEYGEPIVTFSLVFPEDEYPKNDPFEIYDKLNKQVDIVIDSGYCDVEGTTVVDMLNDEIEIVRYGIGTI